MKTREYEFEGRTYRWYLGHDSVIYHQERQSHDVWFLTNIPPTPAAASALAALIEDMQVRVIAEWEGDFVLRARESENGPVVEYLMNGQWYEASTAKTAAFRAGYEAGKAAR